MRPERLVAAETGAAPKTANEAITPANKKLKNRRCLLNIILISEGYIKIFGRRRWQMIGVIDEADLDITVAIDDDLAD